MLIRSVVELNKSNTHRRRIKMMRLHTRSVTVGVHKKDNQPYSERPDRKPATIGMIHEFGTSKLPARIWLRIFKLIGAERAMLWDKISDAIRNNDSVVAILGDIGKYQKKRVKERITKNEVTPPSKSPITLVETGHLLNSIDYEVH